MKTNSVLARSEDLQVEELQGEALVLNPVTLQTHHLNQYSFLVWSLFDGSRSLSEIIEMVVNAYDEQDPTDIEKEIVEISEELIALQLIDYTSS